MKKNFENLLGGAIAKNIAEEKAIKDRIVIREEFKKLIPPLNPEELEQLEANILEEGVRDPIVLWENGTDCILVDGHNRFSICSKHNLDFPFKLVRFKDEEEVSDWMIKNQLGRRNLTIEQQSYLRGLRYNREKSQGKRTDLTLDQNDLKSESTAASLAKEYNVSEATIKRDGEFAEGVNLLSSHSPDLKDEILQGKSKLSKQEIRSASKSKKGGEKKITKAPPKKISVDEIAEIALNYLQSEKRPFEEVCSSIGFDQTNPQATEFFLKWNNNLNQQ